VLPTQNVKRLNAKNNEFPWECAQIDAGALQCIVDDAARALVLLNRQVVPYWHFCRAQNGPAGIDEMSKMLTVILVGRETWIGSRHFSESVGEKGGTAVTLAGAVRGIVEASVASYWKIRDSGGGLVAGKGAGRRGGEGSREREATVMPENARSRGVEMILDIAGSSLLPRATTADRLNGKGNGNDDGDGGIGGGCNSGGVPGGCTVAILQRGCLVSSVGPHP